MKLLNRPCHKDIIFIVEVPANINLFPKTHLERKNLKTIKSF